MSPHTVRSGPMTWAQDFVRSQYATLDAQQWWRLCMPTRCTIPPGTSPSDVEQAVRATVAAVAALRTTFELDRPVQHVHRDATVEFEVAQHDHALDGGNIVLAQDAHELHTDPFAARPAVRAVCRTAADGSTTVSVGGSHLAFDRWAQLFAADVLNAALRGEVGDVLESANDGLDRVAWQDSAEGSSRARASLEALRRVLDVRPVPSVPRDGRATQTPPRAYRSMELSSARLLAAADVAAARLRVPFQSVIFGLVNTLLAAAAGREGALCAVFCDNRLTERDRSYSGCLMQPAPVYYPLAPQSADASIRSAAREVMRAAGRAAYPWAQLCREPGFSADLLRVTFNGQRSRSALPTRPRRDAPAGTISGRTESYLTENFDLAVISDRAGDRLRLGVLFTETVITARDVHGLLRAVERAAQELADSDVAITRFADLGAFADDEPAWD